MLDLNPEISCQIQKDTSEEADSQKLEINHEATLKKLQQNMTIVGFCTNDLQEKRQYSQAQPLLMSNFSFLLKLSVMQLFFVGMAMIPTPALISLLIVEIVYLISSLGIYLKHRHLKSIIILIPKVTQSLLLIGLEVFLLAFFSKLQNKNYSLTKSQQIKLGHIILFSNIAEYLFVGLSIFMLIRVALSNRRREKSDNSYREYIKNKNSIFVFKKREIQAPKDSQALAKSLKATEAARQGNQENPGVSKVKVFPVDTIMNRGKAKQLQNEPQESEDISTQKQSSLLFV